MWSVVLITRSTVFLVYLCFDIDTLIRRENYRPRLGIEPVTSTFLADTEQCTYLTTFLQLYLTCIRTLGRTIQWDTNKITIQLLLDSKYRISI